MSLNKVILIGNLGKDPDVKYLNTGVAVANFPLATTERGYVASNGTQVPDRTEWHNIVVWGKLAEVVEKYVHKGDKIWIEGKIKTRSYSDKAGVQRYVTEIFADNMEMLTPKGATAQQGSYVPPTQTPGQSQPVQQPNPAPTAQDNPVDDLPF